MAAATQHHGKEMSYNNYLDADAAYSAVCDYSGAHLTPPPWGSLPTVTSIPYPEARSWGPAMRAPCESSPPPL